MNAQDLKRHAFLTEHGLGNFYKLPPDHVGYITGATMEKLVDLALASYPQDSGKGLSWCPDCGEGITTFCRGKNALCKIFPAGAKPAIQGEPVCQRCKGSGVVDDGEIDCFEDGTPYQNGPIKCVKDCPSCAASQQVAVSSGDLLRGEFERLANKNAACGLKRSRKGAYVNPSIARDWKWFQLGAASQPVAAEGVTRDAARYRWLREQQWNTASLFVIAGSKSLVRLGTDCPSLARLDAAIDAALSGSADKETGNV